MTERHELEMGIEAVQHLLLGVRMNYLGIKIWFKDCSARLINVVACGNLARSCWPRVRSSHEKFVTTLAAADRVFESSSSSLISSNKYQTKYQTKSIRSSNSSEQSPLMGFEELDEIKADKSHGGQRLSEVGQPGAL